MIKLDGAPGEGGGQIIRTAVGLSLLTGVPLQIENVRAKRSKPGLQRQHVVAVLAAAEVGRAQIAGVELGSGKFHFVPQAAVPGDYRFDIGSAGSTTLVLQTVLPALMLAEQPSTLTIDGGTHNPLAPTAGFLAQAFGAALAKFGPRLQVEATTLGFYPQGQGRLEATITPVSELQSVQWSQRGAIVKRSAVAICARLPRDIGERELAVVRRGLDWSDADSDLRVMTVADSGGAGNVLELTIESEHAVEVVSAFGERGKPAGTVAAEAVSVAERYLVADVPIGEHLADQLLIPLALAGGEMVTLTPSLHTTTNMRVIEQFLPVKFSKRELTNDRWLIEAQRQ